MDPIPNRPADINNTVIKEACARLDNVYSTVEDAVSILEDKLISVLSPEAPTPEATKRDEGPGSSLANYINSEADRGANINHRLRTLIDRIEL